MIDAQLIETFAASFRGNLIRPENENYDTARALFNGMIDKRPGLIAQCANVADVIATVNFARENNVLMAIRGGGHNGAGLGSCNDGIVLDLSLINNVHYNPLDHTVRVGGGAIWADVDHTTQAFGRAVPTGVIASTGVGGLTLGGGHGYLTRQYGLTIDNLISADIVLADGTLVTADSENNSDLFWAIRGGGGNFGVAVSFLFQSQPAGMVYAGPILWELDKAKEAMQWYRDFMATAPDELYGFFAFMNVPPGEPFPEHLHMKTMCGVVWHYNGPLEDAEKVFKPIREFSPPALDLVGPLPHAAVQGMFDPLFQPGQQWYWKGDFFTELTDEAIDQHLRFGSDLPSLLSTMHLYPVDGAAGRIAKGATAWDHRDAKWSMVIAGIDPDPANKDVISKWAKAYWEALHPYSAGGAYVNFMMEEGEDRIKNTYRQNYERLSQIKAKYDPENFFRVNQNIKPAK